MVITGARRAMANDLHFKYVNVVRKPDGSLREWEEYDDLVTLENSQDMTHCRYTHGDERRLQEWKHKLIDNEKRS